MSEKFVYPYEYFLVQTQFAMNWLRVISMHGLAGDLSTSLTNQTTLLRELTDNGAYPEGQSVWNEVIANAKEGAAPTELSRQLHTAYLEGQRLSAMKGSVTKATEQPLSVTYTHHPNTNSLQTHYKPHPINGKSALSKDNRTLRFQQYQQVFREIQQQFPSSFRLIERTWLYNLEAYCWILPFLSDYFSKDGEKLPGAPANITYGEKVYPPEDSRHDSKKTPMSLNSWSTWGQFLHKGFNVNERFSEEFLQKIAVAQTIEELVNAFPYIPLYHICTVGDWEQHLFGNEEISRAK